MMGQVSSKDELWVMAIKLAQFDCLNEARGLLEQIDDAEAARVVDFLRSIESLAGMAQMAKNAPVSDAEVLRFIVGKQTSADTLPDGDVVEKSAARKFSEQSQFSEIAPASQQDQERSERLFQQLRQQGPRRATTAEVEEFRTQMYRSGIQQMRHRAAKLLKSFGEDRPAHQMLQVYAGHAIWAKSWIEEVIWHYCWLEDPDTDLAAIYKKVGVCSMRGKIFKSELVHILTTPPGGVVSMWTRSVDSMWSLGRGPGGRGDDGSSKTVPIVLEDDCVPPTKDYLRNPSFASQHQSLSLPQISTSHLDDELADTDEVIAAVFSRDFDSLLPLLSQLNYGMPPGLLAHFVELLFLAGQKPETALRNFYFTDYADCLVDRFQAHELALDYLDPYTNCSSVRRIFELWCGSCDRDEDLEQVLNMVSRSGAWEAVILEPSCVASVCWGRAQVFILRCCEVCVGRGHR